MTEIVTSQKTVYTVNGKEFDDENDAKKELAMFMLDKVFDTKNYYGSGSSGLIYGGDVIEILDGNREAVQAYLDATRNLDV